MENDELELTEMVGLDVMRQDGVVHPVSGVGFIVMKSAAAKDVNAVGGIDETPDIAGAEQVLCLLYKLLESEAREGAIGAHEECDVNILSEAISLIKWFKCNEECGALEDDGSAMKSEALAELDEFVVAKAHRKFSSDERKQLASEGKALEDGSYPTPDADALRRAAILARSGHGDVAAAKRLIAKRARELGVKNPLSDNDAQKGNDEPTVDGEQVTETSEAAKAEETSADALSRDEVQKMIADALTAETSLLREDNEKLSKELEVLKATPIPGGPVITATADARAVKAKTEAVAKAAYFRRQAENTRDRELIVEYTKRAAEQEALAR